MMATDNEKLCMAIVNNSIVTKIDWPGVGEALGLKVNSAQKRWKRFKDASSTTGNSINKQASKTIKGAKSSKKRRLTEVSDGEEAIIQRLPARAVGGKKAKIRTPSSDEEEAEPELAAQEGDRELNGEELVEGDMDDEA
jgi:hypothetical protein